MSLSVVVCQNLIESICYLLSEDNFEDKAREKISNLQDRLDETVNHYETKLKELRAQNRSLSKNSKLFLLNTL